MILLMQSQSIHNSDACHCLAVRVFTFHCENNIAYPGDLRSNLCHVGIIPQMSAVTAQSIKVSIDDSLENKVEVAGANLHETPIRELSRLERFYVDVANVYTHEQAVKVR